MTAVSPHDASMAPTERDRPRFRFGFDIGGTFTDFVLIDGASGTIRTYKTLTTPRDPARAVIEGWRALVDVDEVGADAIELAVHGTTLITNALIERAGAVTGLVTTKGFRDVLEMRKEMRYDIYDLLITLPDPLVPRPLRLEVDERVTATADVLRPLDPDELDAIAKTFREAGVEAVAVVFLHSYRNATHEQLAGQWLRENLPDVAVSLSSEVAPEIREYERTSTTVTNAYVQPLAGSYLRALGDQLRREGFERNLYLMLSSGGITTLETAVRFPIRLLESGPAAGVLAAAFYGQLVGDRDLVSFDMGGTTAKMCLIKDGQPEMANTFEIARVHRFKRGSGLPVQVRSIELIEIGAGGGSIARVDDLGLLKVGPSSAGADPGPACYGLGGTEPTVTDADLVLGYLNPDNFLGGRMPLSVDAAAEAIGRVVAEPMGLTVLEAAWGIHQVVNENMTAATRIHVAERGADVRRMRMIAFGGAGPVHSDAIARALKMRGTIIPSGAGVTSALGFLTAPISFELARSVVGPLDENRLDELDEVYSQLEQEGRALLAGAGVAGDEMRFVRQADLRHMGQGHDIVLELPFPRLRGVDLETELEPLFYARYESVFGHAHRHLALEIVTCRLTASGPLPALTLEPERGAAAPSADAVREVRRVYFHDAGGFVETTAYERASLAPGATFRGPAVIEEKDSTAVVAPGATVVVDPYLNLVVTFDD
jgi:N-methylhydantoinase A